MQLRTVTLIALLVSIGMVVLWHIYDTPTALSPTEIPGETAKEIPNEGIPSNTPTLDMSGQNLSKVPSSVFTQTELQTLNLSHNQLAGALQAEIHQLQNLTTLDLSNNAFTGIPGEIGQLKKLETLDLSNNQLTGLPYELGNLSSLKILNLSGNSYSEADLAIIKQKLPVTTTIITK